MIARLVLMFSLMCTAAFAVQPDEMLSDPVLESRAQALDHKIRCVKCQSEAIASSNAAWAKTARIIVRERLSAGDTDDEVVAYFVARYGEYVRMSPRFGGATLWLWLLAPIVFVLGTVIAVSAMRRKTAPPQANTLSAEEQARLKALTAPPDAQV